MTGYDRASMSNLLRNSVLALTAISTLGVLASCGRRDRPKVDLRQHEDPRMLKAFGTNEARFCSFQFPYSETTDADPKGATTVLRVTALGDSKADLATNLSATCAKLGEAAKSECEKIAAAGEYPCVAPSLVHAESAAPGLWNCTLPFTANDVDETLTSENQSTGEAAIAAVFTACAELTDVAAEDSAENLAEFTNLALTVQAAPSPVPGAPPSPRPSTPPSTTPSPAPTASPPRTYTVPSKRRDACAAALLAEKLSCTNANAYPAVTPSPKPPRRLRH